MNAPLPESVKISAAQSVVNWLQERVKLVRFFRYNAQAKHGVPQDGEDPSAAILAAITYAKENEKEKPEEPEKEPEVESKPTNVQNVYIAEQQQPPETAQPPNSGPEPVERAKWPNWLKSLLLGGGIVGTGLGSLLAGYYLSKDTRTINAEIIESYKQSGYQFLEDEGGHLP